MIKHLGPDSVYVQCDVCKGKFRRKDTVLIRDKWNLQNGLVVCKSDVDQVNDQIKPIRSRKDRLVTNPKTLRSESADQFLENENDDRLPGAPRYLEAKAGNLNEENVELSWQGPEDGGSSGILGYLVERAFSPVGAFIVLKSNTNKVSLTYTDEDASEVAYRYRVAAINSFGTGLYSAEAFYPVRQETEGTYLGISQEDDNILITSSGIPIQL